MSTPRQVRVGCEFEYDSQIETPAVFQVQPHDARPATLRSESWQTTPEVGRHAYTDVYGNDCQRLNLPAGVSTVRYDALFSVPDATEEVDLDAPEMPVTELPDETLLYTLPSRYVLPDVLGDEAWRLFGGEPAGYRRVQSICDYVNGHLSFAYGSSTPLTTAADVHAAGRGVCRDFAHLAITFCRALNIPARYVFGYLPDMDVEPLPEPMDFAAWMEVYLGDRWWTFDPRNNRPRKGRVRIGRGRDALDVAMVTTYGAPLLKQMLVWSTEVGHDVGTQPTRETAMAHRPREVLMSSLRDTELIDHNAVDLESAEHVTYLLRQRFRYDYDGPAYHLAHRLVIIPRARHGSLRRRLHSVDVSLPTAQVGSRRDTNGNLVVRIRAEIVPTSVEFSFVAVVERAGAMIDAVLPAAALSDQRLLRPTRLTTADSAIRDLAADARAGGGHDLDFAERCCRGVQAAIRYEYGVTSPSTPAAQALAGGRGVCQDHAHVMLAACRAVGVRARYVSGHLLGDSGTHAWVEIVVADGDRSRAVAFDPCNGCRAGSRHLPVATGRDYADVAPTSGSYGGSATGRLTASKHLGVTAAA